MTIYVEIGVNVPQVRGVYHYHAPAELQDTLRPGHLVVVPFGKQQVQGVVLRRIESPEVPKTRAVEDLLDPEPVLTDAQMELAAELSKSSLATLAACIDLMLPPGLSKHAESVYTLLADVPEEQMGGYTAIQQRLMRLLWERGPLRSRQIDRALPKQNWRASAGALVRQGVLSARSELPEPSVRPKTVRTAALACPPERAQEAMAELGQAGSQALHRRQVILQYLMREAGPVEVPWLYAESGGNINDLRRLEHMGLIALGESEVWRDPLEQVEASIYEAPALTSDQRALWEAIRPDILSAKKGASPKPILLHGVTGSGKTEIYLQAVAETLRQGRQALVLVPEIALTPQTTRRFLGRFPGQVGLVHSGLSDGERYDTWRRARSGSLPVIVGPRSALFTPLPDPGLIVLDECHDDSYYQSEPAPSYHARELAVSYARLLGAVCLMGSATPDVSSYFQARQDKWELYELPKRILGHKSVVQAYAKKLKVTPQYRTLEGEAETIELPPVKVVDMRQELKAGNRSIFSRSLQAALAQVLEQRQQAILFLNRRGTATYVFCRDCGYSLKCPRCDLPLTYHGPRRALTCHYCGYKRNMPATCPQCRSTRIRQYGTGTEKVEDELQQAFPGARTLRWDYETTQRKGAHDVILSHFANQRADVLIGTQMLAKGLDLPLVTLVGVVLADVGLNLPDYRAAERVFQVLTQVAGRAGRSPFGGQVILQTFQPQHYAIQAAAQHDYNVFYQQELAYRRKLGYPPLSSLVRLEYRSMKYSQAETAAAQLAGKLQSWIQQSGRRATEIIGPAPCFFARIAGEYRWQIVLRGPDPAALLREHLEDRILQDWRVEVNPSSLL